MFVLENKIKNTEQCDQKECFWCLNVLFTLSITDSVTETHSWSLCRAECWCEMLCVSCLQCMRLWSPSTRRWIEAVWRSPLRPWGTLTPCWPLCRTHWCPSIRRCCGRRVFRKQRERGHTWEPRCRHTLVMREKHCWMIVCVSGKRIGRDRHLWGISDAERNTGLC